MEVRTNWSVSEVETIYQQPLLELVYQAASVHRHYHDAQEVQMCTLLSIKTGGCPEDCSYCPQAARYASPVSSEPLMQVSEVMDAAERAVAKGSSRFCMGAAWRRIKDNKDFDRVIEMVKGVNALGLEVCCTLGMLTEQQAQRLAEAGLHAYNHNIDTSKDYYQSIISTRQFEDRLETLGHVRKAGISVCSGGIIGLGESAEDRIGMLHTLATLEAHPESVPINALVPVEGTPLEEQERVSVWEMVRAVATARVIMPQSKVRLSAGRQEMSEAEQAFCFMAGANSIFTGDRLLTTPNPGFDEDLQMLSNLGLRPKAAPAKVPAKVPVAQPEEAAPVSA